MFTNKQFRHREHLLCYCPFKVCGFFTVWVDVEVLFDVPGKVLLLVLSRRFLMQSFVILFDFNVYLCLPQ